MQIQRSVSVVWSGGLEDGRCAITTQRGVLSAQTHGFASRLEGKPGTNPDELLGAAHAACSTTALMLLSQEAKLAATWLDTSAKVELEQDASRFTITAALLTLRGVVSGGSAARFAELAGNAKAGCPVSNALHANITLDAALA